MTEQFCIIGRVTADGTILCRSVNFDEVTEASHQRFWPGETKKLFRFYPVFWRLDSSALSTEPLTDEDEKHVLEFMGRVAHRPAWTLQKAS